jgi:hypothetical protein
MKLMTVICGSFLNTEVTLHSPLRFQGGGRYRSSEGSVVFSDVRGWAVRSCVCGVGEMVHKGSMGKIIIAIIVIVVVVLIVWWLLSRRRV